MRRGRFQAEKRELMELVRQGALPAEDGIRILEFWEGRRCAPFQETPGFGWPTGLL